MSESGVGSISWLHGLQDYLEFKEDLKSKQFIDLLLRLNYAKDPILQINPMGNFEEFVSNLRKFADNEILHRIQVSKSIDPDFDIRDAFSRGQIQSKVWLAKTLKELDIKADHVLVIGSWIGLITRFIDTLEWKKLRLVDLDRRSCVLSDKAFNLTYLDDYKCKAVAEDINKVELTSKGYTLDIENFSNAAFYSERLTPNLVINTSAEHMSNDWFLQLSYKKLETDPIIVIQSNNLFEIEDHVNSVHSINHMKKIYPMSRILFEGELQLEKYKRFMLIGKI